MEFVEMDNRAEDEKAVGRVIWEGPSLLTNKMFVVVIGTMVRITFAEQPAPDLLPIFRSSVAMTIPDAIAFSQVLKDVIAQLEEVAKAAADKQRG
jgi:hypothetical protein